MRTVPRANAEPPAASDAPEPNAKTELNPPPGSIELDSGDVDEIIELAQGESFEAVYKGSKKVKSKKPNTADSHLHKFKFDDGVARGMWGSYQLDEMLEKVDAGKRVWIAYIGTSTVPGSGNTMHNWRVALVGAGKTPF